MATADDDVITIDGDGEFIVEEDEGASIPVVEVYEAYANAVGEASANAEMFQREAQQAFERADADALLQASINMRLALAEFSGAAAMMGHLGLNPDIRLNVEVTDDAEGQR